MVNSNVVTLTVTGLQYQKYVIENGGSDAFLMAMGDEERDVVLKAEPDNEFDPRAVRVEMEDADFNRVGYVAAEETDIVHAMLGGRPYLEGKVCGNDRHKTFFVSVQDTDGKGHVALENMYLWRFPDDMNIDFGLRIPISEDEKRLETIEEKLVEMDVDSGNISAFLHLLSLYAPLGLGTVNKEDAVCRRIIYLKILSALKDIRNEEIICEQDKTDLLELDRDVFRTIVSDYHTESRYYDVYRMQTERIRKIAETEGGFRDRYCKVVFKGDIGKAPKVEVLLALKEVEDWLLKAIPNNAYALYKDQEEKFAHAIRYANLSREKLYFLYTRLYTAHLLKEELRKREIVRLNSLPKQFSGDEYMPYWNKLVELGYLTSTYQLNEVKTTHEMASYIAHCFSELISSDKAVWKSFEEFWGVSKLAQNYNKIKDKQTDKMSRFKREMIKVFVGK